MEFKNTIPGIIILGVISSLIATCIWQAPSKDHVRKQADDPKPNAPAPVVSMEPPKPPAVTPVVQSTGEPETGTSYSPVIPTPAPAPTAPATADEHPELQKFWSPLSVEVVHYHRVGESPSGTLSVSPSGISWLRPGHPDESFQDKPCTVVSKYESMMLDVTINGTSGDRKPYRFKVNHESDLHAIQTALYALCDSPKLEERARALGTYYSYSGPPPAVLFSKDKGDFVLFRYDAPAPWVAMLDIDVNQNGEFDSRDVEYSNRGLNPCDAYVTNTSGLCDFHSLASINVEPNKYPIGPFGVVSGESITSVTRLIPKSELSTNGPFVTVLLRAYNTKTKEITQSQVVKIPFAMASD